MTCATCSGAAQCMTWCWVQAREDCKRVRDGAQREPSPICLSYASTIHELRAEVARLTKERDEWKRCSCDERESGKTTRHELAKEREAHAKTKQALAAAECALRPVEEGYRLMREENTKVKGERDMLRVVLDAARREFELVVHDTRVRANKAAGDISTALAKVKL